MCRRHPSPIIIVVEVKYLIWCLLVSSVDRTGFHVSLIYHLSLPLCAVD